MYAYSACTYYLFHKNIWYFKFYYLSLLYQNNKDMKVGSKVTHNRFGSGRVIKDEGGYCNNGEVYVMFDNPLPYMESASSEYAFSKPTYKDIVNLSDLK